jgi:hypothetical protein
MGLGCWNSKPCFAAGCGQRVAKRMLMCAAHWRLVSHANRVLVYSGLDIWQCGGSPREYLAAIKKARLEVTGKEAARRGEILK